MKICIPKKQLKEMVDSMKKLGDSPFDVLENMTSKERRDFFKKFTDEEVAKEMNHGFETAILKGDEQAIMKWAKKNLKPADEKEVVAKKKDFIKAIESGEVYEELVKKQLGIELSSEEVANFSKMGKDLIEAGKVLKKSGVDEAGNLLGDMKDQLDFFGKLKVLNDYAESIAPYASVWDRYTSNIWKAGVLATIKSTGLNVLGNLDMLVSERGIDRLVNRTMGTKFSKIKKDYITRGLDLYHKTDFDVSRSDGIDAENTVIGIGKYAGEAITTPKSEVMKKVSRFVYGRILGTPDVASGLIHRIDSTQILAEVAVRKGEKLIINGEGGHIFKGLSGDALEEALIKDSLRLTPVSEAGKAISEVSIHNARVGTFTNDGNIAMTTAWLKRGMNKYGNLGEILIPFAKTPSNVIAISADYAGIGSVIQGGKILNDVRLGREVTRREWGELIKKSVRAGVGISMATAICNNIDSTEYIGSYDPAETKSRDIKGATSDSVKIGETWVSLDYFGPLRTPIKACMELKKKKDFANAVVYTVASEMGNLPIFEASGVTDFVGGAMKNGGDLVKSFKKMPEKILNRIYSGAVGASQLGDFARGFDDYKRNTKTNQYEFLGINLDSIASKIPGLRETLPRKSSVGGDILKENGVWSILTGARTSKGVNSVFSKEYSRLESTGHAPSIKDILYRKNDKVIAMGDELGLAHFENAKGDIKKKYLSASEEEKTEMIGKAGRFLLEAEKEGLGQKFSKRLEAVIDSDGYKTLDDEDKKRFQEKMFKNEYEKMLYRNNVIAQEPTKMNDEEYLKKARTWKIERESGMARGGFSKGKGHEEANATTYSALESLGYEEKNLYIKNMSEDDKIVYKKYKVLAENPDTPITELGSLFKKEGAYSKSKISKASIPSLQRMRDSLKDSQGQFMTDEEFAKSMQEQKTPLSALSKSQRIQILEKYKKADEEEKARMVEAIDFTK